MKIKNKADIENFLFSFCLYSSWDGTKFYLVFTNQDGETTTLMQYPDTRFTIYRKYNRFWDLKEIELEEKELNKLIWANRKYINQQLKVTFKEVI